MSDPAPPAAVEPVSGDQVSGVSGGCLCGRVRFAAVGPLRPIIACHCRQCRKTSGHFWAATQAKTANLTIEDDGVLRWFHASPAARRGFCVACGSNLFWEPIGGDVTSLSAGALEAPVGLTLTDHIYVADKGDYYKISDGLPQQDVR